MDFNVLTEMTEEGRNRLTPTADGPVYYVSQSTKAVFTGSAVDGSRRVPPVSELERAMKKALAAASYLPVDAPERRPSLVVVFSYGSHAIDPEVPDSLQLPPSSAEDWLAIVTQSAVLQTDVIERAALIGGPKFAQQLKQALSAEVDNMNVNHGLRMRVVPVSPDSASPFQVFVRSSSLTAYLVKTAFHTCYFVVASAYDHDAMVKGQRRLLWRTKMTVDAQGVSMEESLAPLIASAAPYFGRDMNEVTVVRRRISRDGKVEVGEAKVVEEDVKAAPLKKP